MKKELSEKKKLLRLIVISAACFVIGASFGLITTRMIKGSDWDPAALLTAAAPSLAVVLTILYVLFSAALLTWSGLHLRTLRRQADGLDPDDDAAYDRIEKQLDLPMVLSSVVQVTDMALFAVLMDLAMQSSVSRPLGLALVIINALVFLASLFLAFAITKRSVDLEKQLNPEKRGSVLDRSFIKTWEASCDEAQKQMIYEGGYRAFQAGSHACLILWLITVMTMFLLGTGFFPVICVCAIWLVLQLTYHYVTARLERGLH